MSGKADGFIRIGTRWPDQRGCRLLQEIDNPNRLVFKLLKTLYIEEEPGPDPSFLEVEITSGGPKLATPTGLADHVMTTDNITP